MPCRRLLRRPRLRVASLVVFHFGAFLCDRFDSSLAMFSLLSYGHAFLQLLLYFTLPQTSLSARIPIHPLPQQVFYNTFNIYTPTGKGGCYRNAPNGVQMMAHTIGSLGGALAVAQTVAQNLPNYPTETYIRALLFLFFGITFQANHQLRPDVDNVNAFNNITSMAREGTTSIFIRSVAKQYTQILSPWSTMYFRTPVPTSMV